MATAQTPEDFGFGRLFCAIREAVIVADALVPDRLRARHRAGFARYGATGRGPLIDAGTPVEVSARRKGGGEVPVELTLTPLDAAGGCYVLALIRDLSERRRAEEARLQGGRKQAARAEAERAAAALRFQAHLLDAVGEAVIATDLAGRITHWNPSAERLYGWPAGEVLGRDILDVTPSPRGAGRGGRHPGAPAPGRALVGEAGPAPPRRLSWPFTPSGLMFWQSGR